MVVETGSKAEVFKLHAPLLSLGRTNHMLARTDMMSVMLKVYAEGGENAMHKHTNEDHIFVVLAGEATFHLEKDENTVVVKQYEGIMLPKGAYYWFQSSGDENLVLLRVGAPASRGGDGDSRMGPDGLPLPSDSAANKHIDGVPIPGKFFGG